MRQIKYARRSLEEAGLGRMSSERDEEEENDDDRYGSDDSEGW